MAPSKEIVLRGAIGPAEWELIQWRLLPAYCEAGSLRQFRKSAKYVPNAFADFWVRVLVNVLPFSGSIRPHHQAKALDQTVSSGAAGIGSAYIFRDADGLCVA